MPERQWTSDDSTESAIYAPEVDAVRFTQPSGIGWATVYIGREEWRAIGDLLKEHHADA